MNLLVNFYSNLKNSKYNFLKQSNNKKKFKTKFNTKKKLKSKIIPKNYKVYLLKNKKILN